MAINVLFAVYGGLRNGRPLQEEAADVTQALQEHLNSCSPLQEPRSSTIRTWVGIQRSASGSISVRSLKSTGSPYLRVSRESGDSDFGVGPDRAWIQPGNLPLPVRSCQDNATP